ncbi:hypothetical protein H8959_015871 [Pygathrix nigripes]
MLTPVPASPQKAPSASDSDSKADSDGAKPEPVAVARSATSSSSSSSSSDSDVSVKKPPRGRKPAEKPPPKPRGRKPKPERPPSSSSSDSDSDEVDRISEWKRRDEARRRELEARRRREQEEELRRLRVQEKEEKERRRERHPGATERQRAHDRLRRDDEPVKTRTEGPAGSSSVPPLTLTRAELRRVPNAGALLPSTRFGHLLGLGHGRASPSPIPWLSSQGLPKVFLCIGFGSTASGASPSVAERRWRGLRGALLHRPVKVERTRNGPRASLDGQEGREEERDSQSPAPKQLAPCGPAWAHAVLSPAQSPPWEKLQKLHSEINFALKVDSPFRVSRTGLGWSCSSDSDPVRRAQDVFLSPPVGARAPWGPLGQAVPLTPPPPCEDVKRCLNALEELGPCRSLSPVNGEATSQKGESARTRSTRRVGTRRRGRGVVPLKTCTTYGRAPTWTGLGVTGQEGGDARHGGLEGPDEESYVGSQARPPPELRLPLSFPGSWRAEWRTVGNAVLFVLFPWVFFSA